MKHEIKNFTITDLKVMLKSPHVPASMKEKARIELSKKMENHDEKN